MYVVPAVAIVVPKNLEAASSLAYVILIRLDPWLSGFAETFLTFHQPSTIMEAAQDKLPHFPPLQAYGSDIFPLIHCIKGKQGKLA